MERDEMSIGVIELKAYFELLAKYVEATAKSVEDAARIIREAKPE